MDDLPDRTTDIVPGRGLVIMDREYANDGVKDVCKKYDIHYLNPGIVVQ